MRALFVDHSPRREQAPRNSRSNKKTSSRNNPASQSQLPSNHATTSSSGGGGAAARRAMRAKAQTLSMQPAAATNRRRTMAMLKYGEDDRKSETSMHRNREHARLLAQRMSDEASSSPQHEMKPFGNFAAFETTNPVDHMGDNDSTFHSQASSFFDEDPFGIEPAAPIPVRQQERKDDSFVNDWPTEFEESPSKSMSTLPSNSSMQSAYAKQQHQQQAPSTPKQAPRTQQHSQTQPRMHETPDIRPSESSSASTGAAARRRMRQQMKNGADLTPPQSPHSLKRYTSGDSLGSSQKNRIGDHVQHYANRAGSSSNRSVSGKSVGSSASGSDIFDHRSGVGVGFTFDAFGLDASQINAQVDEAMQDLVGSHPDFSFFQDDDFANGRWNQQASPAPSRASTPPITEEAKDEFVDGFRVTKAASLPVHIRQQYSPSASERSSLTSESNHDDGRVNLFKEKAAFAASKPRMIVRPSGPPPDNGDFGVERRGRMAPVTVPDPANQQIEFVGEDSEASFPQNRFTTQRQQYQSANSDVGARSDGGVASDVGVQSGADSDAAVQSDHGRNTRSLLGRDGGLPLEVLPKKKSSTDTTTTAETSGTYQMPFEEKKEEEPKEAEPVRNVMAQWQQREAAAPPSRSPASPTKSPTKTKSPTLTRQSLEKYQSGLDQRDQTQNFRTPEQTWPGHRASTPKQVTAPKSEGGAMVRSSHVNSVLDRIQAQEARASDSKSDTGGPSPYQVKLRKTGLIGRPGEDDDAGRPVTPMGQRGAPRRSDVGEEQENVYSRALVPVEEPKKLTYRERRELELVKQREEEQKQQERQQSPEKDVASLIRKRIAASKKTFSPPDSSSKGEAQDKLGSLRPTAPYARSSSNEYSRDSTPAKTSYQQSYHGQSSSVESDPYDSTRDLKSIKNSYQEPNAYQRQHSSMETDSSKDFSIESAGSGVLEKLERQPNSAVSHLRLLEKMQSNNANKVDLSPEAMHQMLVSVGSGDAEDHKKSSSTPKATKMMLNAFLAGRSSLGEGAEAGLSDGNASSGGGYNGLPALKDDPKYEKYFKMMKLGMPKEQVQHAMVRDGEDPSILDQDPKKPAGIPLMDDPTYQKYFKMLRVGMPMEAVKHAMVRDGLDCSVMDQDHNLPVSKMTKKSDEDDEPKERDSRRRARLHWQTLRKVTSNSLWAKIDQEVDMGQIEIDEQEFQELFQAEHDEVKPAKTSTVTPAKGVTVRVIDPKRANNGGIILARLKISHDDMADAVDRINEHALNAEQIEHIIEFLPSKEERKALETYMLEGGQDAAEKFEGLCECEKFMVSMMTVKHAKRKVRALLFKLQFEKCLDDILKDTLAIEAACDNLTHSVRLRQLLGIILNFGNRLNTAGNKRRKAGAFTLDSLLKLNQAKAFDRKTTFLNYIILIVQRNNEILLNFKDDLPAVFKADKVFWDQCLSDLEEVENQLENVRKIALYQAKQAHYRFRRRKKHDDDGDESLGEDDMNLSLEEEVEFLRSTPIGMFTLSAIKYVSSLRDKVEETKAKFAHLVEYFGEEDKNSQPHELFATIVTFCRDFEKAKEEVFALEKKKQREERKRQVGRPPTHSPAAPVEKKRHQPMLKASSHQPNFSDVMRGSDNRARRSPSRHQPEQRQYAQQETIGHEQNVHRNSPTRPQHPSSSYSRREYERSNSAPEDYEHHHASYSRSSAMPVQQQYTSQQSSHAYEQSNYPLQEEPYPLQEPEPRHPSYSRSNSMPAQQQQQQQEHYSSHGAGDAYTSNSSQTGALSAAARLKAKARIQRRTSPTPPEAQSTDTGYYEAQSRAGHYEAQALAVAQARMAGNDSSHMSYRASPSQTHYSSAPPPSSSSTSPPALSANPSRSPRSSFRHKRRMEVRERIRQANSRG